MSPQEKLDRFRNILAFFLVSAFVVAMGLMIFWGMPVTSKDIVTYMVGQLSGMASSVLIFYFSKGAGQDQADAAKTENTGKMAEAIAATAKAATPIDASRAADAVAGAAVDAADQVKGERP